MAIARVTSASGFQNDVDATLNTSYTVAAGDNRLLVVGACLDSGKPFVSVTYNAIGATQDKLQGNAAETAYAALYSLVAPDVTTADVVVTKTGTTGIVSAAIANYTGCKQTAQPDATASASSASASSASYTITTVVDDCWIMTSEYDNIGGIVNGTNFVQVTSPTNGIYLGDSNASVGAAGVKTIAFSWGSAGPYRAASGSYAPWIEVAASTRSPGGGTAHSGGGSFSF